MGKFQLTGLWVKDGLEGTSTLSGTLKLDKPDTIASLKSAIAAAEAGQKVYINIFPNSYKKEGDNKPDWVMYINAPDTEGAGPPKLEPVTTKAKANILQASRGTSNLKSSKSQSNSTYEIQDGVSEDDIPF